MFYYFKSNDDIETLLGLELQIMNILTNVRHAMVAPVPLSVGDRGRVDINGMNARRVCGQELATITDTTTSI
ncbi:hypothetical protein D9M68_490740 [compost metagenome]